MKSNLCLTRACLHEMFKRERMFQLCLHMIDQLNPMDLDRIIRELNKVIAKKEVIQHGL